MLSYRICEYTIRSNVLLPELVPGDEYHTEFTFELCAGAQDFLESCQWLNYWYSLDGSIWLAFAKVAAGYLLRFPELADFVISTDARMVRCYLRANCPPETMRHLLLNQVIPIVLSHVGKLILHASACATPHGAIAFMGMTGTGKSTLAASFGVQGFAVLTDDCLLVEEHAGGIATVPSYPGVRLWPETVTALFEQEPVLQPLAHYTDKKRLLFEQDYVDGRLPLRAIYVLTQSETVQDSSGVSITSLEANETFFEIVKHTFQLDITDRERLGRAFKQYEWLAKSGLFFRLAFPREHTFLSAVNVAILNHVDMLQNGNRFRTKDTPSYVFH